MQPSPWYMNWIYFEIIDTRHFYCDENLIFYLKGIFNGLWIPELISICRFLLSSELLIMDESIHKPKEKSYSFSLIFIKSFRPIINLQILLFLKIWWNKMVWKKIWVTPTVRIRCSVSIITRLGWLVALSRPPPR